MAYQIYLQMQILPMVQKLSVALGGFCFLGELANLVHRRVLVPSVLVDAQRLFVEFPAALLVVCIYPNCKSPGPFVLVTKASQAKSAQTGYDFQNRPHKARTGSSC